MNIHTFKFKEFLETSSKEFKEFIQKHKDTIYLSGGYIFSLVKGTEIFGDFDLYCETQETFDDAKELLENQVEINTDVLNYYTGYGTLQIISPKYGYHNFDLENIKMISRYPFETVEIKSKYPLRTLLSKIIPARPPMSFGDVDRIVKYKKRHYLKFNDTLYLKQLFDFITNPENFVSSKVIFRYSDNENKVSNEFISEYAFDSLMKLFKNFKIEFEFDIMDIPWNLYCLSDEVKNKIFVFHDDIFNTLGIPKNEFETTKKKILDTYPELSIGF